MALMRQSSVVVVTLISAGAAGTAQGIVTDAVLRT
jgi:hypothetical protein